MVREIDARVLHRGRRHPAAETEAVTGTGTSEYRQPSESCLLLRSAPHRSAGRPTAPRTGRRRWCGESESNPPHRTPPGVARSGRPDPSGRPRRRAGRDGDRAAGRIGGWSGLVTAIAHPRPRRRPERARAGSAQASSRVGAGQHDPTARGRGAPEPGRVDRARPGSARSAPRGGDGLVGAEMEGIAGAGPIGLVHLKPRMGSSRPRSPPSYVPVRRPRWIVQDGPAHRLSEGS
jgi:hypothetical protein